MRRTEHIGPMYGELASALESGIPTPLHPSSYQAYSAARMDTMHPRALWVILIASFVIVPAKFCPAQLAPPVSISDPPIFRPKAPTEIKSVEDAMAAIITITSKDLGLPQVKPLYLHLHKTTNDFAANGGFNGRRLSPQVVSFAVAVAEENRFHINMEKTQGRPWSALIRTLAHEYAHNIEYIFSSLNRGPQWLREGFADWVAAKVLDNLGWLDYSTATQRAKLEVRRQASFLPALSELEDSNRWSVWANGPTGSILTYRFAFLAVDRLISRGGLPAIEKYFATQDFATQFGISWRDFEKEFKAAVVQVGSRPSSLDRAEKPEWKIGYRWVYEWRLPGRKGTLSRQIDREEMLDDLPAYVLKAGNSSAFFSKETLGLIATASQEKLLTKQSGPHEIFSWPLAPGREWRTNFAVENIPQKTSQKFAYVKVIPGVEEVKVPAGVFEAFKIETYRAESGALVAEQWYAPNVRWFAKTRDYVQDGVREEELASMEFD